MNKKAVSCCGQRQLHQKPITKNGQKQQKKATDRSYVDFCLFLSSCVADKKAVKGKGKRKKGKGQKEKEDEEVERKFGKWLQKTKQTDNACKRKQMQKKKKRILKIQDEGSDSKRAFAEQTTRTQRRKETRRE